MPLWLNARQLCELIEQIEAGGGEATELRRELKALEAQDPLPRTKTRTRRGGGSKVEEEEETTEERLARRVGYLFPNGIPYKEILDYDYRFRQEELMEQCRKAGLGVSGDKKELAAKLLAKGILL